MDYKANSELKGNARFLRKNMTEEERHLWYDFLKGYPRQFYRQKILGRYIADFYCPAASLVIELDGSQHYEESGLQKDGKRTEYLEQYGIRVVRVPNNEIHRHFREVCEYIDGIVKERLKQDME